MTTPSAIEAHRKACADFGAVVNLGAGAWKRPSPCREWTAGDIVEHVVGLHEVLLPRSVNLHPVGRRDETTERWNVTSVVIDAALEEFATQPKGKYAKDEWVIASLPALTVDVLVHTWDLARALGVIVSLNAGLCASALTYVNQYIVSFQASGLFESAVPVRYDASKEMRLLALLGRNPSWASAEDTRGGGRR